VSLYGFPKEVLYKAMLFEFESTQEGILQLGYWKDYPS